MNILYFDPDELWSPSIDDPDSSDEEGRVD
jgi:hypothetical protein